MNKAIISGEVSSYGPSIAWTDTGKPQTSLTLVLDKAGYKTFVPVMIVGTKAEQVMETISGGDYLIIEGSLSWKAGRTKESSRLQVVAFDVERLASSPQDEMSSALAPSTESPVDSMSEDIAINHTPPRRPKKRNYPKAALSGGFQN